MNRDYDPLSYSGWWESQVLGYIWNDDSYRGELPRDPAWNEEMAFIGEEFEKAGWEWCLNGQHWKPHKNACYSCDF